MPTIRLIGDRKEARKWVEHAKWMLRNMSENQVTLNKAVPGGFIKVENWMEGGRITIRIGVGKLDWFRSDSSGFIRVPEKGGTFRQSGQTVRFEGDAVTYREPTAEELYEIFAVAYRTKDSKLLYTAIGAARTGRPYKACPLMVGVTARKSVFVPPDLSRILVLTEEDGELVVLLTVADGGTAYSFMHTGLSDTQWNVIPGFGLSLLRESWFVVKVPLTDYLGITALTLDDRLTTESTDPAALNSFVATARVGGSVSVQIRAADGAAASVSVVLMEADTFTDFVWMSKGAYTVVVRIRSTYLRTLSSNEVEAKISLRTVMFRNGVEVTGMFFSTSEAELKWMPHVYPMIDIGDTLFPSSQYAIPEHGQNLFPYSPVFFENYFGPPGAPFTAPYPPNPRIPPTGVFDYAENVVATETGVSAADHLIDAGAFHSSASGTDYWVRVGIVETSQGFVVASMSVNNVDGRLYTRTQAEFDELFVVKHTRSFASSASNSATNIVDEFGYTITVASSGSYSLTEGVPLYEGFVLSSAGIAPSESLGAVLIGGDDNGGATFYSGAFSSPVYYGGQTVETVSRESSPPEPPYILRFSEGAEGNVLFHFWTATARTKAVQLDEEGNLWGIDARTSKGSVSLVVSASLLPQNVGTHSTLPVDFVQSAAGSFTNNEGVSDSSGFNNVLYYTQSWLSLQTARPQIFPAVIRLQANSTLAVSFDIGATYAPAFAGLSAVSEFAVEPFDLAKVGITGEFTMADIYLLK